MFSGEASIIAYGCHGNIIASYSVRRLTKRWWVKEFSEGVKSIRLCGKFHLQYSGEDMKIPFLNFNIYHSTTHIRTLQNFIPKIRESMYIPYSVYEMGLNTYIDDNGQNVYADVQKFLIDHAIMEYDITFTFPLSTKISICGKITTYPIYANYEKKIEELKDFHFNKMNIPEILLRMISKKTESTHLLEKLCFKAPKKAKYPPVLIHPLNEENVCCDNLEDIVLPYSKVYC